VAAAHNVAAGWKRYVATVAGFVTESLGTATASHKGFDPEVWNELTFGTHFLYINDYCEPDAFEYDGRSIWKNLVATTAEHIDAHADAFQGVRLTNGFANTIPWPAAAEQPQRVTAINKHPYAGRKQFPADEYKGVKLNARKFVIAYYVMTRDVTKDLPPDPYTVELAGLDGQRASFQVYDPISDRQVPVRVEGRNEDSVRLLLTATDYPYLLVAEE
jgi:hypothetical protein